jgi:NAD(P)-dependent dehydrogenase (short-subunit alcohol dehydrogenase family)
VNETKNTNVFCRKCDLEDFHSIGQFAEGFLAEQKRLDILINNAAIIQTVFKQEASDLTRHGIEQQFGINHVGHFILTNSLLDILKKSSPSRIIVVTCFSHADGQIDLDDFKSEEYFTSVSAFDRSKLANILYANHLADILKGQFTISIHINCLLCINCQSYLDLWTGTGVTVNSVNPGLTATEVGRQYNFIDDTMPSQKLARPIFEFVAKTPYQGALTSIYAALEPSLERVTGKYFR